MVLLENIVYLQLHLAIYQTKYELIFFAYVTSFILQYMFKGAETCD